MLEKIKAVLFDLDGTLMDSMWMWESIDAEYLKRFHIALPWDLQSQIEGMSFSETAVYFKNRFSLPDDLDTIKADWNRMAWDKYENQVTLKPGAAELLKLLKGRGIKTGIATSNSRELADLALSKRKIKPYLDAIRTSCEAKRGKPWPDIYLLTARDLDVEPCQCLVFEDVVQGILAGKRAGMKVCAVEDKFSREDRPRKRELADYYIDSFWEIEELRQQFGNLERRKA